LSAVRRPRPVGGHTLEDAPWRMLPPSADERDDPGAACQQSPGSTTPRVHSVQKARRREKGATVAAPGTAAPPPTGPGPVCRWRPSSRWMLRSASRAPCVSAARWAAPGPRAGSDRGRSSGSLSACARRSRSARPCCRSCRSAGSCCSRRRAGCGARP